MFWDGNRYRIDTLALFCPAKDISLACPNDSSNESSIPTVPVERGPVQLSGSSRAIIKQCFSETNPICLDPGHPTVVFSQDQISTISRIVTDESAPVSFEMLNSAVQRASRLNLNSPSRPQQRNRTQSSTDPGTDTDVGSESMITYGTREGDSSQAVTSDAESRPDFQSSITLQSRPGFCPEGVAMRPTEPSSPACSSPGGQTLATLKQGAIKEKGKGEKRTQSKNKSRSRPTPRRRIGRIMKEEYFETMS